MKSSSYYGLSKNLFQKNIDVKELYKSESFNEGMARLQYLKEIKGIGLITRVPGVGKTTLLRYFISTLNKENNNVIYISLTTSKSFEFLTQICKSLNISLGDCYLTNIKKKIQEEIIIQKKQYNRDTIIIIDNAEKLDKDILSNMSYLYEFEIDSEDYTSIVFCGNEGIKAELKKSICESLRQRLLFSYNVEGITKEETKEYVVTRLNLSGQSKMIYSENALLALHNGSRGIIRKLNTLINLSMIIGYQMKKSEIDEEMIRIAIEENKI